MFTKLTLENFKNFKQAELALGPFTVLVGANATGKSNLREAFRFLHGIGRGYTIPDIIGEKWSKTGIQEWYGIRGGIEELIFLNNSYFSIHIGFDLVTSINNQTAKGSYYISALLPSQVVRHEYFYQSHNKLFETVGNEYTSISPNNTTLSPFKQPILSHLVTTPENFKSSSTGVPSAGLVSDLRTLVNTFVQMRFFEFNPDAMKTPSFPGQTILGDRGENLSSVLYAIWQDPQRKQALLSWLEEIMPGEIVNLEFPTDQIGRVLVTMVESSGQKISAYSLSDGTLRFLAMLAAFFGPERAKFYFFEELETGIHPTRLYLLTQLIENQTAQGDIQVVASTHSPLLLNYLSAKTLESASLLYRLEGEPDAHIRRILDIPHAERLIKEKGIMPLYESGWLEDAMFLIDEDEPQEPVAEAVA